MTVDLRTSRKEGVSNVEREDISRESALICIAQDQEVITETTEITEITDTRVAITREEREATHLLEVRETEMREAEVYLRVVETMTTNAQTENERVN